VQSRPCARVHARCMRAQSCFLVSPRMEPRSSLTIFFSSASVNLYTVPSSCKRRAVGGGAEGGGGGVIGEGG